MIIRAGKIKRNVTLPKTLVGLGISGAKFDDDTLKIKFITSEQNAN